MKKEMINYKGAKSQVKNKHKIAMAISILAVVIICTMVYVTWHCFTLEQQRIEYFLRWDEIAAYSERY